MVLSSLELVVFIVGGTDQQEIKVVVFMKIIDNTPFLSKIDCENLSCKRSQHVNMVYCNLTHRYRYKGFSLFLL